MVKLYGCGTYLAEETHIVPDGPYAAAQLARLTGEAPSRERARDATMAWSILRGHNTSGADGQLKIRFDALASHDITYVGIIQTAGASGMEQFPLPYILTNCHNSLCAVGGTINEDDHRFALSAARKYGGIYVPAHLAVIHQYMREQYAGCGRMILGSDSHTRYGALGTLAVGEGGGELAKQLLGRTWDIPRPQVVAVYLENAPRPGVGPQDVALAIIGAVFKNGFVKNKVMEFVGPGIAALPVEYRNGIDVMTTETACLSSIWATDEPVRDYLETHGRPEDYAPLRPGALAYYDGLIRVDLAAVEPMIALPFHPSNVYSIRQFLANAKDLLHQVEGSAREQFGKRAKMDFVSKADATGVWVDQGIVAGCAGGTYHNLCAAADVLEGRTPGCGAFSLSVYPSSQPTYLQLMAQGVAQRLMGAGVVLRSAFCGPCFGAGDVPAHGALSIRHTTRNFPNREGSKPGEGQLSAVALMDARSIAATAANGGRITPATELDIRYREYPHTFDRQVYENRVYQGFGAAQPEEKLQLGPNIVPWPRMPALPRHLLLQVAAVLTDPVTTTDELIPSGETSSYRSNPLRLAEFTLSRRDPGYVARAKEIHQAELLRQRGETPAPPDTALARAWEAAAALLGQTLPPEELGLGSVLCAVKPGDGSAREQAASCQRVLGGCANIAVDYATKRYRSNLINWGLLPFQTEEATAFRLEEYVLIPDIRAAVEEGRETIAAHRLPDGGHISLTLGELTADERKILLAGCLINYYREKTEH